MTYSVQLELSARSTIRTISSSMMAAASASLFMWPGVRSVGASSLVLSPWIRHLISRLLILRSNIGRIAPRRLLGLQIRIRQRLRRARRGRAARSRIGRRWACRVRSIDSSRISPSRRSHCFLDAIERVAHVPVHAPHRHHLKINHARIAACSPPATLKRDYSYWLFLISDV